MPNTDDCKVHEERIDDIDATVHKTMGFIKSAGVVFSICGAVLAFLGAGINAKLGSIETLLTDSKVNLMKHEQQIIQLQSDVREINERHKHLDQNGVVKRVR